jgi:hypothetical protein
LTWEARYIPNYSIKTLYWEYLEQLTKDINADMAPIDLDLRYWIMSGLASGISSRF